MKHARSDYDRIQDPAGLIPEDEPVFLIRGQDLVGPETILHWADRAEVHGASKDIVSRARAWAFGMLAWQAGKRVKVADMPEDA